MTPAITLNNDVRGDAAGLWHRAGVKLPRVLNFDGTALTNQEATVAPGTDLALVPLPYREVSGNPLHWTGAAIVGTREPDMFPYLSPVARASLVQYPTSSITQPESENHIRSHLLAAAGFESAPWHLWILAGWKIEGLAAFLFRLSRGGAEGALSVAERRAACALRQTWLATVTNASQPAPPVASAGGIYLGRALLDVATALEHLIDGVRSDLSPVQLGKAESLRRLLVEILARYVHFTEQAECPKRSGSRKVKLMGALKAAKAFMYVVAMFTQSDGNLIQRVDLALRVARPPNTTPAKDRYRISEMLDRLEGRLSALDNNAQAPNWRQKYSIGLKELRSPCRSHRLRVNQSIRTDLIYKLIVTRRLDQLYRVLPWMASFSDAFRGVWGGPIGAIAQMFEAARTHEIAVQLVCRLYDPGDTHRLDVAKGRQAYRNPITLARQVKSGTRAGFRIAEHACSHHIAKAWLAGAPIHRLYPIAAAARGSLVWSTKRGIADPQTAMTVIDIEKSKRLYLIGSYDKDLPTYAGLTLIDLVGKHTVQTFRADLRGRRFTEHMARMTGAERKIMKRKGPTGKVDTTNRATLELVRSVLKTLDVNPPIDIDTWQPTDEVPFDKNAREMRRFDDLIDAHVPSEADADGGSIRRTASKHEKATGDPTQSIWRLVNRARTWPKSTADGMASADAPLEWILEGSDHLGELTPIGHQPIYVLWFRPDIDRHLIGWISVGAPVTSPIGIIEPGHAELISGWVDAVRSRAAPLYAKAQVDRRIIDVAVVQFTGFSGLMSDDAHLRL